jgi:hypothetical protein
MVDSELIVVTGVNTSNRTPTEFLKYEQYCSNRSIAIWDHT